MATEIDIAVTTTTYDVTITATPNEYIVNITTNAGGGIESVTGTTVDNTDPLNPVVGVPNLTQVLTIGDRVLNTLDTSRDFELLDRTKFLQVGAGITLTLNETSITFPDNSCIVGSVFDGDSDLSMPDGVYYLDAIISTITLNKGDYFELKKGVGAWILTVTNKSSGAVDSVNGQTGVVVLDADDVGAEPTKGADDNYVTDAQLVVIGNTSGTNTGDNATNTTSNAYADAKVADAINNGTTTIAPSQNAVFDALDFTRRLITKGTGSVTGTVSETILTTLTIPANTLDSSCFIWTTMDFFKATSGSVTARLYINSANTLTGATLLGYSTLASNRNVSFNRKFLVTGTSLDLLTANTASSQVTNEFIEALFAASTVLTINPSADIFLIYTTQNDATGTVATNKMATVQKMKL